MNKNLFSSTKTVPVANTVNNAGGNAYAMSNKSALAQLAVTSCLNGTFYSNADEQLKSMKDLCNTVDTNFLAQLCRYSALEAGMKDTPALLLGIIFARNEPEVFERVFKDVVKNTRMLRNFVQVVRSGVTGRKSFGTIGKRAIQNFLKNSTSEQLFRGSIGNDPSLADVVKMVHPKAESKNKEAFYGWLIGKEYNKRNLPKLIRQFEDYKLKQTGQVPDVDFRMLSSLKLSADAWREIALNATWNTLRMNLNTFQRNGVFNCSKTTLKLAEKLASREEVKKNSVFPYQLLTTFQNVDSSVPTVMTNALQDALEAATENVPEFNSIAVGVDVSGSMNSPVTGSRGSATTKTTCIDVAALFAVTILRKNPTAKVIPFCTRVHKPNLNPRDSIMTNASKLKSFGGGGTDCSSFIRHLNESLSKESTLVLVSDNESWFGNSGFGRATNMAEEWNKYKKRVPNAKLVCIDITPNKTVQVQDGSGVLNVGGFSDSVFTVIDTFTNNKNVDFVKVIENY